MSGAHTALLSPIEMYLQQLHAKYAGVQEGEVASVPVQYAGRIATRKPTARSRKQSWYAAIRICSNIRFDRAAKARE
jgi:hypothetical protein